MNTELKFTCLECLLPVQEGEAVAVQDDYGLIFLHETCVRAHNNQNLDDLNTDKKFYSILEENKLA